MTPNELRTAGERLGLKPAQLASLLGYEDPGEIELGETAARNATIILFRAYLEGYRSPEWPTLKGDPTPG